MSVNIFESFAKFIAKHDGINDKSKLSSMVMQEFGLTQDGSVYYNANIAIRFSRANGSSFGNTVLALSKLQKYDTKPFVLCLVTPDKNYLLLMNSTFLKKISHSSQTFRENNIKGSINGSDIMRSFEGIQNDAFNIERLFQIHEPIGFDGNLARLVAATNGIQPTGKKFQPNEQSLAFIMEAPQRAADFLSSDDFINLKQELDKKVDAYKNEIVLASLIDNVNVRGRVIEYLIAGEDEALRQSIIAILTARSQALPPFKTDNDLGDFSREFEGFLTETDVKTKIMIRNSNPKAYNLDKILEFLSKDKSVFMFYFVGIDPTRIASTTLVSMFDTDLLESTILLKHWAGRNSRGTSQFEGRKINQILSHPKPRIDVKSSKAFLESLLSL